MRLDDTDDIRRDILDWSEPVVSDRIADAYDVCFGGNAELCKPMSRQHTRLWRLIISSDKRRAADARRDLLRLARASRLGAEALDAIDRLVLDELVDVIASRFQGSPAATRRYSRLVVEAAATLTETRLVSAA
jgi:hypothetical protein